MVEELAIEICECAWPPAPSELSLSQGEVHVWAIPLQAQPPSLARFAELLSAEEQERAGRFRFAHHRERFVIGRAALRMILSRYTTIAPHRIEFAYGTYGKPALARQYHLKQVEFNLAHSKALALLAIARACPVGIDVEWIRDLPDFCELVERFFSPRECEAFAELSNPQKPVAFFNLWTRKEAWLKATGAGIAHYLKRVEVSFIPGERACLRSIPKEFASGISWSLHELTPAPGFVAALAGASGDLRVQCWSWNQGAEDYDQEQF